MEDRIERDFQAFHRRNPGVLYLLETLAREWFAAGHRRVAIGMLWEVLRWQKGVAVERGAETYQLNNNFRSRYVRLMLERHPEWRDRFETRALRSVPALGEAA